jgi:hypothetical protein
MIHATGDLCDCGCGRLGAKWFRGLLLALFCLDELEAKCRMGEGAAQDGPGKELQCFTLSS